MFDILQLLGDQYNYLKYLLQIPSTLETSHNDIPLINTLELFTYGDYKHYEKYRAHYVELDTKLTEKLLRLTILSLAMEYENLSVSRDLVVDELKGALMTLTTNNNSGTSYDTELTLESILMAMVDENIVNVKVDDVQETLEFGNVVKLRDSYSSRYGNLRILTEDDVASRSLDNARQKLELWMETRLKPIKREFTGDDTTFDTVINERKRKATVSS